MFGLGAIFGRGQSAPSEPEQPNRLPAELAAAIEGATVTFRHGANPDDPEVEYTVPVVRVSGMGSWRHDGERTTAARIQKAYPELSARACMKAARMVTDRVAARNVADFKRRPADRRNWVMDW